MNGPMKKFESSVYTLPLPQETIYGKLSDLNSLSAVREHLPQDKARITALTADSVTLEVQPVGEVTLQVVEREPSKCIKFGSVGAPLSFNLWIQLLPQGESASRMKLTLGADLNPFVAAMAQKPLQEGVEKLADGLAKAFSKQ